MSDYAEHPELPPAEREGWDVPPRRIAIGLVLVALVLVLTGLLVWWLFPASLADKTVQGRVPAYPAPALQADPRADMAAYFRREMQRLNGVWWIDREKGGVHVPIGTAMRRVATEGIADWPARPVPSAPTDATLRNGTPRAPATEHGVQRDVREDYDLPRSGRAR